MDIKHLFKKVVNLVTLSSFLLWNLAVAAPQGGQVVAGNAAITQSGSTTTITQASQNAVINWNGFNTASNEAVHFVQPGPSSVALNRITSGLPTTFAGSLSANGQVWILNPAGVLFTSTAKIDVAGLLATTHSIGNTDFMAGNYKFDLANPNSIASVINNGQITISDNGMAALVAPTVINNGVIVANLGKVALSTGAAFVLDLYGDSLINFGTNAPIQNGSVSNTGSITATGGKVYMTANTAAGILDNVISMSGTIQATSVTNGPHGSIILNGGHAGRVKISGKLDASTGGSIETTGYIVDLEPTAVINAGVGGNWLLDPPDIHTSTYGGSIATALNAGTNVTLSTGVSGPGNGDIFVDSSISWSTTAQLMLGAFRNISISSPVTATGSGRLIGRADLSANGIGTVIFSGLGSVTVNGASGYAKLFYNPTSYATPTDYTPFLLGTAPQNERVAFMMINTPANLLAAGAVGSTSIIFSYALNNNIDLTGSPLSSSIFSSGFGNNFKGDFEGHNYATGANESIQNAVVSSATGGVGILMTYSDGLLENFSITGSSISAPGNVGGVVYTNNGTISNVHFSGSVTSVGSSGAGGIAAVNSGAIKNSFTSGSVSTGGNLYAGGIVGSLDAGGSITNSYNEASVTGAASGGIVGLMIGVSTITNVYNVGVISGGGGALIGAANVAGSTLTGMYWDTTTSGTGTAYTGIAAASYAGTDTPLTDPNMKIAANFPTFDFANIWTTNGNTTYPKLIFMPTDQILPSNINNSNFPLNVPQSEFINFTNQLASCDVSGCNNLEIIMDNLISAGYVSCLMGFAEAIGPTGSIRILMPGDMVYSGETVAADAGSKVCIKNLKGQTECVMALKTKAV